MSRLSPLPLAFALLAFPACSSEPATPSGTAGTAGTAGTSGAGGGAGTMSNPDKDFPTDTSAEGVAAFLAALDYRSATWASGTTAPQTPDAMQGSPHGLVQIWYNKALRQSNAAGHEGSATDPTSMAVKELYTGSTIVGHAVMLRTTDPKWLYYCTSTEANRCYMGAPENTSGYQTGISNCGCHGGGTIITGDKIPVP